MGLDPIEDRDVKIERVQKRPQIKEDATVQRCGKSIRLTSTQVSVI